MSRKVDYLEQRVATTYSIKRSVGIAFQHRAEVIMNLNKSNIVEELLINFLNDTKDYENTKRTTKRKRN